MSTLVSSTEPLFSHDISIGYIEEVSKPSRKCQREKNAHSAVSSGGYDHLCRVSQILFQLAQPVPPLPPSQSVWGDLSSSIPVVSLGLFSCSLWLTVTFTCLAGSAVSWPLPSQLVMHLANQWGLSWPFPQFTCFANRLVSCLLRQWGLSQPLPPLTCWLAVCFILLPTIHCRLSWPFSWLTCLSVMPMLLQLDLAFMLSLSCQPIMCLLW